MIWVMGKKQRVGVELFQFLNHKHRLPVGGKRGGGGD